MNDIWKMDIPSQKGPIVAVALHNGHSIRRDLIPLLAVDEQVRLREEDPYTGCWTTLGDIQITGTHSRFEVDLNRGRNTAVYIKPEDSWSIKVWNNSLPPKAYEKSLARYDRFYSFMYDLLKGLEQKFGSFIVYDLHSYNHRRKGALGPEASAAINPEVNIGTGTMNRELWAPVVDGIIADLRAFDFGGRNLDVRENIKFKGGGFPCFVHEHFPKSGCTVAIEFKKFWMDEWSGEVSAMQHKLIQEALKSTTPNARKALTRCG
ncbi:MAG: N-formylglutamate amidohydrolase [Kiritimatiellae bacterium]|jgi:N-formylglutamate deformylase|nr:N-formylglutamate amidohydrolase [Kiritimatiellia bacterium]